MIEALIVTGIVVGVLGTFLLFFHRVSKYRSLSSQMKKAWIDIIVVRNKIAACEVELTLAQQQQSIMNQQAMAQQAANANATIAETAIDMIPSEDAVPVSLNTLEVLENIHQSPQESPLATKLDENVYQLENNDQILKHVHDPKVCSSGPCPIHNQSNHPLRDAKQWFDWETKIMHRTCHHNRYHPDPDDYRASEIDHNCECKCCIRVIPVIPDLF